MYHDIATHNTIEALNIFSWVVVTILIFGTIGFFIDDQVLQDFLFSMGWALILIVVLIALIPSCGPQIIIVSSWLNGLLPMSAVAANLLTENGDVGIIVLSGNRTAFLYTRIMAFVIGIIIGYIFYAVEVLAIGGWIVPN